MPERVQGQIDQPPFTDDDLDRGYHPESQRIPRLRDLVVIALQRYPRLVHRRSGLRRRLGGWRDIFQRAIDDPVPLERECIELELDRQAFTQEGAVVLGDLDLDDRAGVAWSDAAQGGVGLDLVARLRGRQIGDDTGDGGDDLKEIVLVDIFETDASRGVSLDARGVELQPQLSLPQW